MEKTSSYRQNNDPESTKVKSSSGYKYNNVIRPLLVKHNKLAKKGGNLNIGQVGFDDFMKTLVSVYLNVQNGNTNPENIIGILNEIKNINLNANCIGDNYIYWDNLDELFQRLLVLYGEIQSGNTNPALKNEIIRILQELKEL